MNLILSDLPVLRWVEVPRQMQEDPLERVNVLSGTREIDEQNTGSKDPKVGGGAFGTRCRDNERTSYFPFNSMQFWVP